MRCYGCGKEIPTKWFFEKYIDGKPEYFCDRCTAARIDERSYNGFVYVHETEVKKDEQKIQTTKSR